MGAYYFSTQGWTLVLSVFSFSVLLDAAPLAAAALRALRSKKFDMLGWLISTQLIFVRWSRIADGLGARLGEEDNLLLFSGSRSGSTFSRQAKALYASRFSGKRARRGSASGPAPSQPLMSRGSPTPAGPNAPPAFHVHVKQRLNGDDTETLALATNTFPGWSQEFKTRGFSAVSRSGGFTRERPSAPDCMQRPCHITVKCHVQDKRTCSAHEFCPSGMSARPCVCPPANAREADQQPAETKDNSH